LLVLLRCMRHLRIRRFRNDCFVGRDKIIWGTWDGDLPAEHFDVNFDLTDLAEDNLHPGPIAHKEYAEKIKNVLQDRFK